MQSTRANANCHVLWFLKRATLQCCQPITANQRSLHTHNCISNNHHMFSAFAGILQRIKRLGAKPERRPTPRARGNNRMSVRYYWRKTLPPVPENASVSAESPAVRHIVADANRQLSPTSQLPPARPIPRAVSQLRGEKSSERVRESDVQSHADSVYHNLSYYLRDTVRDSYQSTASSQQSHQQRQQRERSGSLQQRPYSTFSKKSVRFSKAVDVMSVSSMATTSDDHESMSDFNRESGYDRYAVQSEFYDDDSVIVPTGPRDSNYVRHSTWTDAGTVIEGNSKEKYGNDRMSTYELGVVYDWHGALEKI